MIVLDFDYEHDYEYDYEYDPKMIFALSTHWNASKHATGEALLEEILGMGFRHVELGYDLRLELVPGVQKMVKEGAVTVLSLHNYCPVPIGAARGHPEIYTLASAESRERDSAVTHTEKTIRFAAELGAKFVVTHAGNVEMDHFSRELFDLAARGQQFSPEYDRLRLKMQTQRDKKVQRQLDALESSIDRLLPVLEETGVRLCFENLPTWESIPTELELETLMKKRGTKHLGYWHDIGHGQIRQNMGFISHEKWLERLQPYLAGMHVHDVLPPATDHVMPPRGKVDFPRFQRFGALAMVRVIEPTQRTPKEEIEEALKYLTEVWGSAAS
ncbi:MAG TPA: sugar phosphate isomerase/epimerase family protein [Kiritimatiellia bacterium]